MNLNHVSRQRAADMAKYAKAVRAGTTKRAPFTAFKPENSLTPALTPAMLQLQKRPQDRIGVVAALQERGIVFDPKTPFQDLKKLLLVDAAGFMLPLVASPQSEQSVAAPLEVAHAEADGEFDNALPADGPGLAKRVRRPTRFFGESSSDSEANSGSSDGSDSSGDSSGSS